MRGRHGGAGASIRCTAAKIAEVPYERAIRQSAPFFLSHILVIILVSLIPAIPLWLPSLLH